MLLPQLGGSPSVWNACVAFFQMGLLAGYASAMLWMLFAVILLVTLVIIKVSAKTVFYTVEPEGKR